MPIYEYYCSKCNTIYSFLARSVTTRKQPSCPRCRTRTLRKQVSMFAMTGQVTEAASALPLDEHKMEQAMTVLEREVGGVDDKDPRQVAQFARKLTDLTGMKLDEPMREALNRLEAGEEPESIEAALGSQMDADDPILAKEHAGGKAKKQRPAPVRDQTLYEL